MAPEVTPRDVPNYVPAERAHEVTVKYRVEIDVNRVVVRERGDVVYISATGCADNDHSDFGRSDD